MSLRVLCAIAFFVARGAWHTVSAALTFDAGGDLVEFVSRTIAR